MKTFVKTQNGLVPDTPDSIEWFNRLKHGDVVCGKFTKLRNPGFHRKFFALLNYAFECWNPGEIDTKWGKPEKNFEVFRKNTLILAGYGYPVFNIDGSFKMEAKSISFASMGQEEFEKVYNKVLTVLMQRTLAGMSKEEIEKLSGRLMSFT